MKIISTGKQNRHITHVRLSTLDISNETAAKTSRQPGQISRHRPGTGTVCLTQTEMGTTQIQDKGLAQPPGKDCRRKTRHGKTGKEALPAHWFALHYRAMHLSETGLQWTFAFHANLLLVEKLQTN